MSESPRWCRRRVLCAWVVGVSLLQSRAFAQHRDILLASTEDGRLAVIGGASVFDGAFVTRIFAERDLVQHWTTNPGFASLNELFLPAEYAPLPALSLLSFSILNFPLDGPSSANLWYWDGLDPGDDGNYLEDVSFAPHNTGSAFHIYRGGVYSGVADGSDVDQPGFVLAETTRGGGLHVHPVYEVFGSTATPPEQGVYLLSVRLQMQNLEDSDPLYFVLRTADVAPAAGDAARRWLNDATLLEPTPLGDFNFDGVVDAADIDRLFAAIREGNDNLAFDVDLDSDVDAADVTNLVEGHIRTYFGDADLNGVVQFPDFLTLAASFGSEGGWAQGDFDGSGDVQFPDFLLLADNFELTSRAVSTNSDDRVWLNSGGLTASSAKAGGVLATTVPEPSSFLAMALGLLAAERFVRRRSRVASIPKRSSKIHFFSRADANSISRTARHHLGEV